MAVAVPIITAAVAVAGTAASIQQQNAAVSSQNAAISAQISANEQQERIRQIQNRAQRQINKNQYKAQRLAQQTNYMAERQQIQDMRKQVKKQAVLQNMQADLQAQQATGQVNFQNQQIQNAIAEQESATQNQVAAAQAASQQAMVESQFAGQEDLIATIDSLSQALAQVPNPVPQVEQALNDLTSASAQIQAMSGSRGRTSNIQSSLGPKEREEIQNVIQGNQEISAETAQKLLQSQEFADMVATLSQLQSAIDQSGMSLYGMQATDAANFQKANATQAADMQTGFISQANELAKRTTNELAEDSRAALKNQLRQSRTANKLSKSQMKSNKMLADASLITGAGLQASQFAAQRAGLASQYQSGPGIISQFAQIAGQLTPLMGLIGGGGSNAVPSYYSQPAQSEGLMVGLNTPFQGNLSLSQMSQSPVTSFIQR